MSLSQVLDLPLWKQEWNKLKSCLEWGKEIFVSKVERGGLTKDSCVSKFGPWRFLKLIDPQVLGLPFQRRHWIGGAESCDYRCWYERLAEGARQGVWLLTRVTCTWTACLWPRRCKVKWRMHVFLALQWTILLLSMAWEMYNGSSFIPVTNYHLVSIILETGKFQRL